MMRLKLLKHSLKYKISDDNYYYFEFESSKSAGRILPMNILGHHSEFLNNF